ncbi:hypothetical protein METH109765_10165 [Mesobacillus thioparans]
MPEKVPREEFGHIKREYVTEKAPMGKVRSHKVVEAKNFDDRNLFIKHLDAIAVF